MKKLKINTKAIILLVLQFFLVAMLYAQDYPAPCEGYKLIWAEEFDENAKPNPEFWSFEEGFVRNHELQWYQKDNATIENGVLSIEGRRIKRKNPNFKKDSKNWKENRKFVTYTSSSINTRNKFEFQYGIVEVKAKIDTAKGMWPAIWTLGTSMGWPANGEIDIMEYYRVNNKPHILANAAWAHANKRAAWDETKIPFSEFLEKDPQWSEKYHIWKMDWNKKRIKLFLDDELLNEIDLSKTINPDGSNPFHQPHYILLNLALGSNGGNPEQTEFPRTYKIDYVRVYQQK